MPLPRGKVLLLSAKKLESPAQVDRTVQRIMARWEAGSHSIDYIIASELKRGHLSPQQKAQITDQVCNWARGRGAARYLLSKTLREGIGSLAPSLRLYLEKSICQLLFEERTPRAVIVYQATEKVKRDYGESIGGMANAILRTITNPHKIAALWPDRRNDLVAHLSCTTSHPDWLVKRWLSRWGEERTQAQLQWDNRRPSIWLRWNLLRGDAEKAKKKLKSAEITYQEIPDFPNYYRLSSPLYPGAIEEVRAGNFSIQDPSASLAVRLMGLKPGMIILDMCAAPGGKTTLMAELLGDDARVMAVDSSPNRLRLLREALLRMGIKSVQSVVSDGRQRGAIELAAVGIAEFDAVLCDVPCSGSGVLGRRADQRWRRNPADIAVLVGLQRELIRAAASWVRPGGVLVYSTCSIEPEENEEIVLDFAAEFTDFRRDDFRGDIPERFFMGPGEISTYSPRDGIDGIYAARLIRQR